MRWCPGCGDYAILKAVQRTMPRAWRRARKHRVRQRHRLLEPLSLLHGELRLPHHPRPRAARSRRGSSSPIPSSTCGSSPATATRCRSAATTLMHLLRRNLNLPDPAVQQRDLRPHQGPIFADQPHRHAHALDPVRVGRSPRQPVRLRARQRARGSSRAGSTCRKNLPDVLKAAHAHQGAAFVEIFQNCIVYNDDVFADFTDRKGRRANGSCGWRRANRCCSPAAPRASRSTSRALSLQVSTSPTATGSRRVIVHDARNRAIAHMLVEMPFGPFPMALGVLYDDPRADLRERGDRAERRPSRRDKSAKLLAKGQTGRRGTAAEPGTRVETRSARRRDIERERGISWIT